MNPNEELPTELLERPRDAPAPTIYRPVRSEEYTATFNPDINTSYYPWNEGTAQPGSEFIEEINARIAELNSTKVSTEVTLDKTPYLQASGERPLTFSDVRRNDYEIPGAQYATTDMLARQVSAAKYLESLAANTKQDISDVPLVRFLNGDRFLTDRRELNQVYFKWLEDGAGKLPPESMTLDEAENLRERILKVKAGCQEVTKSRLRSALDNLAQQENEVARCRERVRAHRGDLSTMVTLSPDAFVEKVGLVLSEGFFQLNKTSRTLSFNTVPVAINYYNSVQGREQVAHLGRFRVEVKFQEGMSLEVWPLEGNFYAGEYYHPHVASNGKVCYGNMILKAERVAAQNDIYGALSILESVLTQYNDDNPYAGIAEFEDAISIGCTEPRHEDSNEQEEEEEDRDNY